MLGTNSHLNLFRFYGESHAPEILENNLSRALALCLRSDALFFYTFIQGLLEKNNLQHLLKKSVLHRQTEDIFEIDLQRPTAALEFHEHLLAVALTTSRHDISGIDDIAANGASDPVTDIYIGLGSSLGIIIEVKRDGQNCLGQLKHQVAKYIANNPGTETTFSSISWVNVMENLQFVQSLQQGNGLSSPFPDHFISLIQLHYADWLGVQPLNLIPFSSDSRNPASSYHKLLKRLIYLSNKWSEGNLIDSSGRISVPIHKSWTRELMFGPEIWDGEGMVVLTIFPGNTKGQGYALFSRTLDWVRKTDVTIEGVKFPLRIYPHIKFSNAYGEWIGDITLNKELTDQLDLDNYKRNFWKSGRKPTDREEIVNWMNGFLPNGWAEHCKRKHGTFDHFWRTEIERSKRNVVNVSLGFQVSLGIPYSILQAKDTDKDDVLPAIEVFEKAKTALVCLVEGSDINSALSQAIQNINEQLTSKSHE